MLEGKIAQRVESNFEPSRYSLPHGTRNNDAARRSFRLQPRSHIHIVAVDVIALDDDVAKVKADSKYNRLFFWLIAICFNHGLLELDCRS